MLRTAHYIRQAAGGLDHAHRAGLIHRDIKPSNIVLDRNGIVKILDLGLARFAQDEAKNQAITTRFDKDSVFGTVDYMAPEQANGQPDIDICARHLQSGLHGLFSADGPGAVSRRDASAEDVLASNPQSRADQRAMPEIACPAHRHHRADDDGEGARPSPCDASAQVVDAAR